MAVDDIMHLWRALGLDPEVILSDKGQETQLGKDLVYWAFGSRNEQTVKMVSSVYDALKKKESQNNEFC